MQPVAHEALELEIRALAEGGNPSAAVTSALRGLGPELYSFLMAIHHNQGDADDVFGMFAEGLWRGLPGFGWQSSFRTWAYAVARRASLRYRRDGGRRAKWEQPGDTGSFDLAAEVRSTTRAYLRSNVRSKITALRDNLPETDRELLLLRVDRNLSWTDLAQVLRGPDDAPLEGAALSREAARLRKRFQSVKQKLRDLASKEGLLPGDD